ncbi:hypothetical protein [Kitasatospora terrestris]|uniref:hypothetical protein n=1 Tax=Kitasatospora terrestris TaxID=258051 RepID=UPI0031E79FAF
MRRGAAVLALVLCAALPGAAAAGTGRGTVQEQSIYLHATAGDGSSDGVADLTVTKENNGYRLRGYIEAVSGCVELRAVNMHLGSYLGGDVVKKTCEQNVHARINSWTHHTDVVLSAVVPHGPDWDSSIVTLTGRP